MLSTKNSSLYGLSPSFALGHMLKAQEEEARVMTDRVQLEGLGFVFVTQSSHFLPLDTPGGLVPIKIKRKDSSRAYKQSFHSWEG